MTDKRTYLDVADDNAEALLDVLRGIYPDAWFMVVPDGTTRLNVPIIVDRPIPYSPWYRSTEPESQTECIQIRQSELVPSLWWGYGEKTNRLAYWIEEEK